MAPNVLQQFDLLIKHFPTVCQTYEFEKESATTGKIEMIKKLSDCISEDQTLMKFVKLFTCSQNDEKTGAGEDEDEDEDQDEESTEEDNACDNMNSELMAQQQQTAALLSQKKMKKAKCKEWRQDTLRGDDTSMMMLMTKELAKLRNEDKTHVKKSHTGRNKNEKLATTEPT